VDRNASKPAGRTGPDSGRTPYSPQRQQAIVQTLRTSGRVAAADIARELNVTNETVRKDIIALERQGLLRRVHGGAVPVGELHYEAQVTARVEFAAEKERIAKAALAHLPASGSIIIDAGSTTARLAALFPDDRELTVFTNALPIALTLLARPRLTVFAIGGRLRSQTLATVGGWAARMLGDINVDVAFLGTNGISVQRGLTTPDPAEAEVKRLILASAQRTVLLADHSKIGRLSVCQHAGIADIDLLITDTGLPPDELAALEATGLTVEQT
jgi:DeoR family transcriptional regulator, fructose operon transcriptional repressor